MGRKPKPEGEKVKKMRYGITLQPEEAIRLEEIRTAYLRQGKKVKIGQVVGEALNDLWQRICKK